MKFEKMHWFGIVAGIFVGGGSLVIFSGSQLSYFLLGFGLLIGSFPFSISFLIWLSVQEEKGEKMLVVKRTTVIAISYLSFLSGCVISPVPNNIEELKRHAQRDYLSIKDVVKPGDIIFRLGNQRVMGGLFNFSKLVADLSLDISILKEASRGNS